MNRPEIIVYRDDADEFGILFEGKFYSLTDCGKFDPINVPLVSTSEWVEVWRSGPDS